MTDTIRIHKTGGPEVLSWEEVQLGKPGPGTHLPCARRNWIVAPTINCAPRPRRWRRNARLGRRASTVAWLRAFCIADRQSSTPTRLGTFNRVSSWPRAWRRGEPREARNLRGACAAIARAEARLLGLMKP
jgi:hypothetical protein